MAGNQRYPGITTGVSADLAQRWTRALISYEAGPLKGGQFAAQTKNSTSVQGSRLVILRLRGTRCEAEATSAALRRPHCPRGRCRGRRRAGVSSCCGRRFRPGHAGRASKSEGTAPCSSAPFRSSWPLFSCRRPHSRKAGGRLPSSITKTPPFSLATRAPASCSPN